MSTQPIIFLKVRGASREELVTWFKKNGTTRWSVSSDLESRNSRFAARPPHSSTFTVTVRGEELAMLVKLSFQAEIIQH